MKKIFWHKKVFLTLIFFVLFGCGQKTTARNDQINYQEIYKELFAAGKYDEALAHLQLWESAEPDNPEMFIAYYNYYTDDIFTAIEYLDRGLDLYPDRLDMHFSKIYIFNENRYYELAGEELFSTLEISKRINNDWVWTDNVKMPNGELFLVSSIQDYYRLWLDAETKEAYDQIKLCAEKQIELYPGYIYSYNYLAVCYLAEGQFQEGLKYLLQAETIAPDDCIVLENIGRTYMNMNDNQKAEEYFMKILEVGNDQDKMYAEYYLNLL